MGLSPSSSVGIEGGDPRPEPSGVGRRSGSGQRSVVVAVLASLVIAGLGHWYLGRTGRAVGYLLAAVGAGVVGSADGNLEVLAAIVPLWAAIGAYRTALVDRETQRRATPITTPQWAVGALFVAVAAVGIISLSS